MSFSELALLLYDQATMTEEGPGRATRPTSARRLNQLLVRLVAAHAEAAADPGAAAAKSAGGAAGAADAA